MVQKSAKILFIISVFECQTVLLSIPLMVTELVSQQRTQSWKKIQFIMPQLTVTGQQKV